MAEEILSAARVILTTAGSEVKALVSSDTNLIERVVKALNDAIVARG